jgi:hypothetical protein
LVVWSWKRNKTLTLFTVFMSIGFVFSQAGVALDSQLITGAPRWLKPAKFAISVAIYTGTLVWLLGQVTVWPTLIRRLSVLAGWLLVAEVVLIDFQAARGTTSHFNVSNAFDAAVYAAMGIMILVVWNISLILLVALFRQRFESRAWGTALRAGVLLTVLGSGTGGLMTRPTPSQLAGMHHGPQGIVGAHTVGGEDGGPGLPLTRWSTEHGDVRVPHFLGIHGMQAIPLFAWLLTFTGWSDARRQRFVIAGSLSYFALFILVLAQALGGIPIVSTSAASLQSWVAWLAVTIAAFVVASLGGMSQWHGTATLTANGEPSSPTSRTL